MIDPAFFVLGQQSRNVFVGDLLELTNSFHSSYLCEGSQTKTSFLVHSLGVRRLRQEKLLAFRKSFSDSHSHGSHSNFFLHLPKLMLEFD